MYPGNQLNQVIQQALIRENLKQVIVEIQETFGDHHNRTLILSKEMVDSIEYIEGTLVITMTSPEYGATTEFFKWEDVRRLVLNDTPIPEILYGKATITTPSNLTEL